MCLQLPRSAVGRVVARMAFRFGALRELLGMASPSPGLQLEVADFGASDRRLKRPETAYVAPRSRTGAETWFASTTAHFCVIHGHFQSFSTGSSKRTRTVFRADEQRGGFWTTCCSPTFRATNHSLTSRCRASNMS
jgi:hypothetical protein